MVLLHLLLAIGLILAAAVATGLVVAAGLLVMTRLEGIPPRPRRRVPQH